MYPSLKVRRESLVKDLSRLFRSDYPDLRWRLVYCWRSFLGLFTDHPSLRYDDSERFLLSGPHMIAKADGPLVWAYVPEGMHALDMPQTIKRQGIVYYGRYQTAPNPRGPVDYFRRKPEKSPRGRWPVEDLSRN